MERVAELKRRTQRLLLAAFTLTSIIGTLVWWSLGQTNLHQDLAAALAGLVTIATGWICALALGRNLNQPISQIAAALEHVGPNAAAKKMPQRSELIKPIVSRIYDLAASAQSITTDLEKQRSFLDAAMGTLPVSVMAFNAKQELVYINPAGSQLLGLKDKSLRGIGRAKLLDWIFQSDEDYDVWLEQSRANTIHGEKFWERVAIVDAKGKRSIGDLIARYEKNESHNIETVVVFVDRTSQYVADEAQLDFVAVAAHELRGPVTVIRGYLDDFMHEIGGSLTVDQQLLLQKMIVSAEMLALYINNILNVARVEQQQMSLHIVEADWREIIQEAYAYLAPRAKAHGRALKLELPDSLPSVGVDSVTITEVINNLVDNAIKYSYEGGEIILAVKEVEGLVETTVEDHGIGIPDSLVGNLFKKFYRSHRTKVGVSGTGLGLYLSKAILDAHGGNIWVRSKEGQGSVFGFDLPTYASIAESIKQGNKDGQGIKRSSHGWIKNHSMYRR